MSFSKRREAFNFFKFFTIEHFLAGVSFEAVFLLNIIVNDQPLVDNQHLNWPIRELGAVSIATS